MKIELTANSYSHIRDSWINDSSDTITTKAKTVKSKLMHRTTIVSKNNGKLVLEISNNNKSYWLEPKK